MPTITIPYTPRTWAKELHNSDKRFLVLVLHRRAGKTTAVLNHLQKKALLTNKSQYAYIAPTYKQAKRIAWEILKNISRPVPGVTYNESELTLTYPNGSKIFLAGSENVDSLRGISLNGGAQDEAAQQPANLFSEVISKALADNYGFWIWLGTPKGKNHFYRTFHAGVEDENYDVIHRTIDESLAEEQGKTIENLRKALEDDKHLVAIGEMTQEEFDQEWYNSFEAAIRGAYYATYIAQARRESRITTVPYDPALKVYTVWDLGVGQAMGIGFYQRSGIETRMIDYWEGSNQDGIPQAVKAIQEKPYVYGKHFAPHDRKATDVGTGKTREDTAKELGITFDEIPNIGVDNGIERGKLMWSHLWVDEKKCQVWLDYVAQYRQRWDDNRKDFVDTPYHDFTSHAADVHRYAALVEDEMKETSDVKEFYQQLPRKSFERKRRAGGMAKG